MKNGYEELIMMRLYNHGLLHEGDRIGLSELLGIQAQFFSYANYAAKIRGIDLEKKDTLFKAWTLRGTMHVHNIKDHNIFIHKELLSKYIKGFWEDGDIVPGDRKNFFLQRGCRLY